MAKAPIVYRTTHRIKFSELDPYNHVSTGEYATYFVDHRMEGLRDYVGWDLKTLGTLPFMVWVRRMEIDFLRPAHGDQEITITSFVREFRGPDALIECTMVDSEGQNRVALPHDGGLCRQADESCDGLATGTSWRCSTTRSRLEPVADVSGATQSLPAANQARLQGDRCEHPACMLQLSCSC